MDVCAEKATFKEKIEELTRRGYLEGGTTEGTAELGRPMPSGLRRVTGGSASNWHRKRRSRVMFRPVRWHCFMRAWVRRAKLFSGWKQQSPSMTSGCAT